MQETWFWSLGWEDPLKKGTYIHSSILAWRTPWTEETCGLQFMGSQRIRHNWVTFTYTLFIVEIILLFCHCPVLIFVIPWIAACQASLFFTISWSLSVMLSNYFILCHPLLLPSNFPIIKFFSNELVLHIRWPKYWSFIFSISPSNEYSRLISFSINWLDLLAIQGTLKSLFQHHSWKAWTLQCSVFFMLQLSHLYMTTGKAIALTISTFVSKIMSLLLNTLSRFVKAFIPRSKCLLISQIIPLTWSMEKVSSTKPVPGAKKFGDHCSKKRKNHQQYTCTKGCLYGKINCKTVASCMPKERTLEEPSCWNLNLEPSASRIEKKYIPVV